MQNVNVYESIRSISVAMHDGLFHLDEMVATALICKYEGIKRNLELNNQCELTIIRTRKEEEYLQCDYVVDVGGMYDGERFFDHHQKDCPVHDNGIPYAATGLVWDFVAETIANKLGVSVDKLKAEMDPFILAVDAGDTGRAEVDNRDIKLPDLAQVVKCFNTQKEEGFHTCIAFVFNYIENMLNQAKTKIEDEEMVQEQLNKSRDGILVLPRFCSWKESALKSDKDIKVALVNAGNGEYSITSALVREGSQESKCPCPVQFREAKTLGDNQVVFIHKSGFTGKVKADSTEQAYRSALAWTLNLEEILTRVKQETIEVEDIATNTVYQFSEEYIKDVFTGEDIKVLCMRNKGFGRGCFYSEWEEVSEETLINTLRDLPVFAYID